MVSSGTVQRFVACQATPIVGAAACADHKKTDETDCDNDDEARCADSVDVPRMQGVQRGSVEEEIAICVFSRLAGLR